MYCNKCGNEIPDGSVFCNKCGSKIITGANEDVFSRLKKLNSKLLVFGLAGVLIIGVIIAIVIFFNNPISKFKGAIKDNKYIEASKIYNEKIKGNTSNENEIISFLKSKIENIKKDFSENKLEYNAAISQLDTIEKTGLVLSEVSSAKSEINSLNDSRTAFKKGKEFLNSKNYKEALSELKKVIKEDENYDKAQEFISSSIKDYKTVILGEAETAANSNDYDKALTLLNEALILIPNDSDISAKKAIYEKLNEEKKAAERKKKMEELKNNQEVSVENIRTFTDWLDDLYISVTVKNNTNKVVKKYIVGWMGFDKDGYPVKTGWLSPDFLKEGVAEANIQPGKTYGSDSGWQLTGGYETTNAKHFLACVKEVEYYDGSKWVNPYYDYWVEEYKEKPLH